MADSLLNKNKNKGKRNLLERKEEVKPTIIEYTAKEAYHPSTVEAILTPKNFSRTKKTNPIPTMNAIFMATKRTTRLNIYKKL